MTAPGRGTKSSHKVQTGSKHGSTSPAGVAEATPRPSFDPYRSLWDVFRGSRKPYNLNRSKVATTPTQ